MSRPYSNESVFRAIADPTRRRIIDLLRKGERTPGDLGVSLRITGPALTFHLRVLIGTGLISQRRRGRHRFFQVKTESLRPALHWLRAVLASP